QRDPHSCPTRRSSDLSWRAELYKDGRRESATFPTKQQAAAWAQQREAELIGVRLPEHTVREALQRYAREVAPKHRGERWELARLGLDRKSTRLNSSHVKGSYA